MSTAADVIAGNARWSAECSDAVEFLDGLPDDSIDLLFCSPPYELARTYGIGEKMVGGQAWVDWMVRVFRAAAPKVKGLIAMNCEGQTRGYRYSAVPFLLMADLHRAGFNLRKPVVFHRVGIPGSGGPDWLRNDWEPVICVTREGRLPWSDNTACGHAPKYGPGGVLSHRVTDGTRVKQNRIKELVGAGMSQREAARNVGLPTMTATSGTNDGGTVNLRAYVPPDIANPGNILKLDIGGGKMGHAAAHDNEAPFPLELPEFFIKSFCPPGGIVCDPFGGSGTTMHTAVVNGRRGVSCDIRQSQIELVGRRMKTVTPDMFAEVE